LVYQSEFLDTSTGNAETVFTHPQNTWENDIEHFGDTKMIRWKTVKMMASQIIPFKVYNESLYSVVCETQFSNDITFFTEKTAKPIIAKRLFIMIAGQYYLKHLRSLGFRTFGHIVDESYDEMENNEERWTAAIKQVEKLCALDPTYVIAQCKDILEHNKRVISTLDSFVLEKMINELLD
jgi:hypothetical protein